MMVGVMGLWVAGGWGKLAAEMLGAFAVVQGVATLAIDLTRTHATNPDWPGHARFHAVWATANVALLTMLTEGVLWYPGLREALRFHLALLLTLIPMLGFMAALVAKARYGGTLRDRYGVPPLRFRVRGRVLEVDGNLLAVVAGLVVSAVLLAVHDGFG